MQSSADIQAWQPSRLHLKAHAKPTAHESAHLREVCLLLIGGLLQVPVYDIPGHLGQLGRLEHLQRSQSALRAAV